MEGKIRYLEMIQSVITRMASNSFLLKGWTVTIVVGLLAFANIDDMDSKYVLIALIPALFFWVLDGFYLHQEKLYRELYKHASALKEKEDIDFSLNADPYKKEVSSWFKVTLSKTLLLFYLPVVIIIILTLLSFPKINL